MQEVFEKIIEELDKLTSEECTLHECGIRSERCKPCIAKKAIEIVERAATEYEQDREYRYMAQLTDAILKHGSDIAEKYEKAVSETSNTHNNGWIPVEERLPERNKPVLVYAESKTISGGTITMVGACDNGFWFIQDEVDTLGFPCRDYRVVAWQPLPESYRPKGE